jgi:hypothetical protein
MLAVGAITVANKSLLAPQQQPVDFRVVAGTAVAAVFLALLERLNEPLAVGLAWISLITVLFVRVGKTPAPTENLLRLMQGK